MLKRIGALCVCILIPQGAIADTVVTWTAEGVVDHRSFDPGKGPLTPPLGTPYSLSLTFDPSSARPTLSTFPSCTTLTVTGSMTLGGASYTASGLGFTNSWLPGSNCSPGMFTEFTLGLVSSDNDLWNLVPTNSFFIASYRDLLVRDAFPTVPNPERGSFVLNFDFFGTSPSWQVSGPFRPAAANVEQPAPVPEPATATLLGLGLVAIARRRLRKNSVAT